MAKTYPKITLHLNQIDTVVFESPDIISATVVQEVHPISAELPISTLTFSIYSTDPKYSMFAQGEFASALSKRQRVYVYEVVDTVEYLIGLFYLDEWKNISEWEFQFTAIDLIGLLEREDFKGLYFSTETSVSNILAAFLPDVTSNYSIELDLGAKTLKGWIKPGTYRDALRQVLFACQGAAITSRSDDIVITSTRYPINDTVYDYLIDRFQIVQGRNVELLPMVTSAEVISHDWEASALDEDLVEVSVVSGTYRMEFDEPYYGYVVSGVTNTFTSSANWIEVTVTSSGTMVITGKPYLNKTNSYAYENPFATVEDKRNVLVVKEAYLISAGLVAEALAEDTVVYYMQRHLQKCSVYSVNSIPLNLMDLVIVDTLYNTQIRGLVEKMTVDLTGGFRTDLEIVGVEHIVQTIYIGLEDGTTALGAEDGVGLITQR